MNKGEFLTRVTIWIALSGYFIGAAAYLISDKRRRRESLARLAWTIGGLSLLAHITFAFHYYHAWSHEAAYRETARQTAAVVGLNWGGGLFINYAMIIAWIFDAAWWWIKSETHRRRPRFLTATWHGFLLFIFFNATVIFKTGLLRWIGLSLCLALSSIWMHGVVSKIRSARAVCLI